MEEIISIHHQIDDEYSIIKAEIKHYDSLI